jgi:hypothetical protein
MDAILSREAAVSNTQLSRFQRNDSLDTIIPKILDASSNEHWDALKAVLEIEPKQELSLIIDGLDKIQHQRDEFIKRVLTFIENLQESLTIKVLLTSGPQVEVKHIHEGLRCIEYDKERKGEVAVILLILC